MIPKFKILSSSSHPTYVGPNPSGAESIQWGGFGEFYRGGYLSQLKNALVFHAFDEIRYGNPYVKDDTHAAASD